MARQAPLAGPAPSAASQNAGRSSRKIGRRDFHRPATLSLFGQLSLSRPSCVAPVTQRAQASPVITASSCLRDHLVHVGGHIAIDAVRLDSLGVVHLTARMAGQKLGACLLPCAIVPLPCRARSLAPDHRGTLRASPAIDYRPSTPGCKTRTPRLHWHASSPIIHALRIGRARLL